MTERTTINYTYSELIDYIEDLGWTLDRNTKHVIYKHPKSYHKISIPHRHKNGMSKGIINKALKIAESVIDIQV